MNFKGCWQQASQRQSGSSEQCAAIGGRRQLQPVYCQFCLQELVNRVAGSVGEFCGLRRLQGPEREAFTAEQLVNGVSGISECTAGVRGQGGICVSSFRPWSAGCEPLLQHGDF